MAVLKDLAAANAALLARIAELEAGSAKDMTPSCTKVMHTPKKGKDVGKSVPRLKISGNNIYPFLLSQKQCDLLAMFAKEIAAYAKTGK
jgi:hypothetical protein